MLADGPMKQGRARGKSVAVILEALLYDPPTVRRVYEILSKDPDFYYSQHARIILYNEYMRHRKTCEVAGLVSNDLDHQALLRIIST